MKSGEDPSNGGTSSGNASQGSSGGTASAADPDVGAPSLEQLKGYCTSLCERTCSDSAGSDDAGSGNADAANFCTDICFPLVTIASHTASCARTAEEYFACMSAVPPGDYCATLTPLGDFCRDADDAAKACIDDYCAAHRSDRECRNANRP